jgi:hypothetical protein
MHDTIVTVRFTDLGAARRALRMLKLLGSEGQLRVRAAALVEQSAHGSNGCPSGAEGDGIIRNREPGVSLVIAEIEDPDPDVLDSAFDALGGAATRHDADAFYAELGAARRR